MRDFFMSLWSGRAPLPRAFWDGAIIYGTALNVVTTGASLGALAAGWGGLVVLALHFAPLPYNVFAVVAVWRSAARYPGAPIWAQLAKAGVTGWAILATLL